MMTAENIIDLILKDNSGNNGNVNSCERCDGRNNDGVSSGSNNTGISNVSGHYNSLPDRFTYHDVVDAVNERYVHKNSVKNIGKKISKILYLLRKEYVLKWDEDSNTYTKQNCYGSLCPLSENICDEECSSFEHCGGWPVSAEGVIVATCYFNDIDFFSLPNDIKKDLMLSKNGNDLLEKIEKYDLKKSYPF